MPSLAKTGHALLTAIVSGSLMGLVLHYSDPSHAKDAAGLVPAMVTGAAVGLGNYLRQSPLDGPPKA